MKLKHIVDTKQFLDRKLIADIFKRAERFEKSERQGRTSKILKNKILASVFYEPSTRTRFSFESAMLKLGGETISTESAGQFSSSIKGEALEDSIKVISGYADVIVLRHPDADSAERAANVSSVPVINAGSGDGEHPTQALLDLYTIKKELVRIDNLKIALVGDLLYGRTIHSLLQLLSLGKNVEIFLISPNTLALPKIYLSFLKSHTMKFSEHNSLKNILKDIDVLYMTRVQKERFSSPKLYEKVKHVFTLDKKALNTLDKEAIIMHPLPRVNEIHSSVDSDRRAAYFQQAKNGLYIRMALLELLLT